MSRTTSRGPGRDEAQLSSLEHQLGCALIVNLCSLEQALRLYDMNNAMVGRVLDELLDIVHRFARHVEEPLSLAMSQHTFFINRRLLRMTFTDYRKAQQLRGIWDTLQISEIVFPMELTMERLREFARHLAAAISDPRASDLATQPWGDVLVRAATGREAQAKRQDPRGFTIRVYCALVVLVRQMLSQIEEGKRPPLVRIKRTIQVLADRLDGNEGLLLALARQAGHGELAAHLARVSLYATLMARRLEMSRVDLVHLATAALFHDVPKGSLKERTCASIERPARLAAADRDRVSLHWLATLLRLVEGGLNEEVLARAIVMYESQLEFTRRDLYGWTTDDSALCLFSRVIAVADLFDTMTWRRPRRAGLPPHLAQTAVLDQAGGRLDPALSRLFIDMFGVYPLGTALVLDDDTVGIVVGLNDANLEQPQVRIVADARGNPIDGPVSVVSTKGLIHSAEASQLGINAVALF